MGKTLATNYQVFYTAKNSLYILELLGFTPNKDNLVTFGLSKVVDKYIYDKEGDSAQLKNIYNPEIHESWANEMINTIALTIDNCKNHNESFKLIFEELHKHGGWLHKNDVLPDDFTIDEFKVELIAGILAYNSGSPIPYIWQKEYFKTHTEVGVIAYQAMIESKTKDEK